MARPDDLSTIAEQERLLWLDRFDESDAWALGAQLKASAEARGVAVAIEIRLAGHTVFFFAMPGTAPENADWARRKRNTVELLGRSSYAVGLSLKSEEATLQSRMGLPDRDYTSHGGAFPIRAKGIGLVGCVTVSGLPQRIDHSLVVETLAASQGCTNDVPILN